MASEWLLTEEERAETFFRLLESLRGSQSRLAMGPEGIEVDVEDLVADVREFLTQATYRFAHGLLWPCVPVDKADIVNGQPAPRWIPLRMEHPGQEGEQNAVSRAKEDGVPVLDRPIEQARRGFMGGVVDALVGRARAIVAGLGANPEVEVTTHPAGDRILFSVGHFFSTARVFGTSDCKQRVPPQTYCFYRSSEKPHPLMPLWNITKDESINL